MFPVLSQKRSCFPWTLEAAVSPHPRIFLSSRPLYQTSASPYLLSHQQSCSWSYTLKMTQTSLAPTFCSSSQHIHLVHFRAVHTQVANWVLPLALQPLSFGSVQSLSRVGLCDPINCSTPGLPVHHQPPESTQTHAH